MRAVSAMVTCGDTDFGGFGPVEMPTPWWNDVGPVDGLAERAVRGAGGGPETGGRRGRAFHARRPRDLPRGSALQRPSRARADLLAGALKPFRAAHQNTWPRLQALPRRPQNTSAPQPLRSRLRTTFRATTTTLRASWATVAGLRAALDWALSVTGPSEIRQVKTWNLAGLFHLPGANAWLKTTPPFAAPESSVIAALAEIDPTLVPGSWPPIRSAAGCSWSTSPARTAGRRIRPWWPPRSSASPAPSKVCEISFRREPDPGRTPSARRPGGIARRA